LFRRFDDIIKYPLPAIQEIASAIKKNTKGHIFDSSVNYKELAKKLTGLNYSDIAKACQATIKEKILSGSSKLHKDFLINALQNKLS